MSQIFISHSAKDRELVGFLSKAFAPTQVKAVFVEFEAILQGPANAQTIAQDIRESNAVFVLLGRHVEGFKHTRDWVGWESGVAAGVAMETNKDVWVMEAVTEMDGLSIVIPHLRHYVCFDSRQDFWQGYLTQIILSYDNSHFLKAISAGAATGGVLGKGEGALWGAGVGFVLAAMAGAQGRPPGMSLTCPRCDSYYNVHLAEARMRCPVCNTRLVFPER
jgi:DNA-directed RNA polymerase subunit RPC12/RpoP